MSKRTKFRGFQGAAGNNRFPVTVRFNLEQQKDLRALCEFWSMPAEKVLKLAFEQLCVATEGLQKKLPKEGDTNESSNFGSGGDGVSSNNSDSVPTDNSGDPGPGSADCGADGDAGSARDEGDRAVGT